jgi:hypothetical protein
MESGEHVGGDRGKRGGYVSLGATTQRQNMLPTKVENLQPESHKSINLISVTLKTPSLAERPIRIRTLRDARRLMGRIIVAFQRGEIGGRDAKDLAYLISVYVQVAKNADLEDRIINLENKVGGSRYERF